MDIKFRPKVRKINWKFDPKTKRCRGFFGKGTTRQYLHRYVLSLANRPYPEVTFDNGDWNDCRLANLRAYDREEDGARRKPFKNRRRKGVSFHKRRKKNPWAAMIRTKGKLRHLGYFSTPELAAAAYDREFKLAHPNKVQR